MLIFIRLCYFFGRTADTGGISVFRFKVDFETCHLTAFQQLLRIQRAIELDELGHQASPAGLMAGTKAVIDNSTTAIIRTPSDSYSYIRWA